MNLVLGSIMAFITNLFNILEVQELAENRNNYKAYQALFISATFGLILALAIGSFTGIKIQIMWIIALHSFIWIVQILTSFTLTTKLHPVTYRIMYGLKLPIIIIIDIVFGNITFNSITLLGFSLIVGSVFFKIRKEGSIIANGLNDLKIFLMVAVWVIGSSLVKVLKYQIRTEYEIGTIDFMITNAIIAIPIYLLFLIVIKEFKPKSIMENKQSHFRAGCYSATQQFLGVYISGYITATTAEILKSLTSCLAVPISKKSKDIKIKQVDKHSYIFFVINIIGTIMIISS